MQHQVRPRWRTGIYAAARPRIPAPVFRIARAARQILRHQRRRRRPTRGWVGVCVCVCVHRQLNSPHTLTQTGSGGDGGGGGSVSVERVMHMQMSAK
jgi:hypothetical protein